MGFGEASGARLTKVALCRLRITPKKSLGPHSDLESRGPVSPLWPIGPLNLPRQIGAVEDHGLCFHFCKHLRLISIMG
jgi:hypothetical protein